MQETTEKTWVLQAQQGNTDAQGELYRLYWEKLYRLALGMTKNRENALDAVQDSFVSAFQHLDTLRDPAAFSSWIYQITANRCRKQLRQQSRFADPADDEEKTDFFQSIPDMDEAVLPESVLEDQSKRALIRQVIEELRDSQRECVLLFYYNGMSVKQIAETQQCTEGTVKSRLNYARQKIGECILQIEQRDGIRLHGALPLGLLLSRMDVPMPTPEQLSQMWQTVRTGVAAGAAAGTAGAASAAGAAGAAGGEAAKGGLLATLKAKIIAGVAATAVATGGIVAATLPDPLVFTDPAMEQNIRVLVGKPDGKLYADDCDELYHMVLTDEGVADVTTSDDYDNLTPLPGTQPVGSLADLQLLPSLSSLELYVDDPQTLLDTLAENTPLPALDTSFRNTAPLRDLSFLDRLPRLKAFSCDLTSAVDLTPLEQHGSVRDLDFAISGDFSLDMSQLPELVSLRLSSTSYGSIGTISLRTTQPLPNLRAVEAYTGTVDSLEFARQAPQLRVISLLQFSGVPVDLTPLSGLQHLRYFSDNMAPLDLAPLADCPALEAYWAPQGFNPPPQAAADPAGNALRSEIMQEINDLIWQEERTSEADAS
ncbi:sigma-70 family RNA polymerase sigma factor [uncultured Agathobaculum sp.]|uniref:RNA polymerase sigma factor n=1 Tax=uncultured Agathobaculum sp. TaxID=2048140 RepID=UPI00320908B5